MGFWSWHTKCNRRCVGWFRLSCQATNTWSGGPLLQCLFSVFLHGLLLREGGKINSTTGWCGTRQQGRWCSHMGGEVATLRSHLAEDLSELNVLCREVHLKLSFGDSNASGHKWSIWNMKALFLTETWPPENLLVLPSEAWIMFFQPWEPEYQWLTCGGHYERLNPFMVLSWRR